MATYTEQEEVSGALPAASDRMDGSKALQRPERWTSFMRSLSLLVAYAVLAEVVLCAHGARPKRGVSRAPAESTPLKDATSAESQVHTAVTSTRDNMHGAFSIEKKDSLSPCPDREASYSCAMQPREDHDLVVLGGGEGIQRSTVHEPHLERRKRFSDTHYADPDRVAQRNKEHKESVESLRKYEEKISILQGPNMGTRLPGYDEHIQEMPTAVSRPPPSATYESLLSSVADYRAGPGPTAVVKGPDSKQKLGECALSVATERREVKRDGHWCPQAVDGALDARTVQLPQRKENRPHLIQLQRDRGSPRLKEAQVLLAKVDSYVLNFHEVRQAFDLQTTHSDTVPLRTPEANANYGNNQAQKFLTEAGAGAPSLRTETEDPTGTDEKMTTLPGVRTITGPARRADNEDSMSKQTTGTSASRCTFCLYPTAGHHPCSRMIVEDQPPARGPKHERTPQDYSPQDRVILLGPSFGNYAKDCILRSSKAKQLVLKRTSVVGDINEIQSGISCGQAGYVMPKPELDSQPTTAQNTDSDVTAEGHENHSSAQYGLHRLIPVVAPSTPKRGSKDGDDASTTPLVTRSQSYAVLPSDELNLNVAARVESAPCLSCPCSSGAIATRSRRRLPSSFDENSSLRLSRLLATQGIFGPENRTQFQTTVSVPDLAHDDSRMTRNDAPWGKVGRAVFLSDPHLLVGGVHDSLSTYEEDYSNRGAHSPFQRKIATATTASTRETALRTRRTANLCGSSGAASGWPRPQGHTASYPVRITAETASSAGSTLPKAQVRPTSPKAGEARLTTKEAVSRRTYKSSLEDAKSLNAQETTSEQVPTTDDGQEHPSCKVSALHVPALTTWDSALTVWELRTTSFPRSTPSAWTVGCKHPRNMERNKTHGTWHPLLKTLSRGEETAGVAKKRTLLRRRKKDRPKHYTTPVSGALPLTVRLVSISSLSASALSSNVQDDAGRQTQSPSRAPPTRGHGLTPQDKEQYLSAREGDFKRTESQALEFSQKPVGLSPSSSLAGDPSLRHQGGPDDEWVERTPIALPGSPVDEDEASAEEPLDRLKDPENRIKQLPLWLAKHRTGGANPGGVLKTGTAGLGVKKTQRVRPRDSLRAESKGLARARPAPTAAAKVHVTKSPQGISATSTELPSCTTSAGTMPEHLKAADDARDSNDLKDVLAEIAYQDSEETGSQDILEDDDGFGVQFIGRLSFFNLHSLVSGNGATSDEGQLRHPTRQRARNRARDCLHGLGLRLRHCGAALLPCFTNSSDSDTRVESTSSVCSLSGFLVDVEQPAAY